MENTRNFTPAKPHFFQPLLPGFHRELSIPVCFYKYYLDGHKCETAVLRSWGGRTWPVRIQGRTFKDGWENFVRDHDLEVGYFLVFKLEEGNRVFDVMVFDTSTCQREYPHFVTKITKEENQSLEEEEDAKETARQSTKKRKVSAFKPEDNYFCLILRPYHFKRFRLLVPTQFARSSGLSNRAREVMILDKQGRSWTVNLWRRKNGQVFISRGCKDLCIANGVKIGDSVKFELVKKGKRPEFKFERLHMHSKAKPRPTNPNSEAGSSKYRACKMRR
ncbi:hypothetical protein SLA2020_216210 [Shorea laevis]